MKGVDNVDVIIEVVSCRGVQKMDEERTPASGSREDSGLHLVTKSIFYSANVC
jgi:hypothetical protein